jgi:hypothetical protein
LSGGSLEALGKLVLLRNGQPEPMASVISFGFLFGICQVLVFEHCRNNTGVEQRLSERPSEQRIAFRA